MRVRVRALGDLMPLIGGELTVELEEDSRLSDLIQKISIKVSDFKGKMEMLSRRQGATDPGFVILLNGRNINLLEGLKTMLKDGDIIVFLPPAAGGSHKEKIIRVRI